MITITRGNFFSGKLKVRAIILEEAEDKTQGIIECSYCDCRSVIPPGSVDCISHFIEKFAKEHKCYALCNFPLNYRFKLLFDGFYQRKEG